MDSSALLVFLTWILIHGTLTQRVAAADCHEYERVTRPSCPAGNTFEVNRRAETRIGDLLNDLRKLPIYGDPSPDGTYEHGLLNFYGNKVIIYQEYTGHRFIQANIKTSSRFLQPTTLTTIGTHMTNVPVEDTIEILSSAPSSSLVRLENPSTLTYMKGQTFFEPLKRRLDAIYPVFKDYCHKMDIGMDIKELIFHIVIDTAVVYSVFHCKRDFVELAQLKSTSTGPLETTVFRDGKDSLSLRYIPRVGKYEWRLPDVLVWRHTLSYLRPREKLPGGCWIRSNYKESWTAISYVDGPKSPNRINHKLRLTCLGDIRFYIRNLKGDLTLLWEKTGAQTFFSLTKRSLRIDEQQILTMKSSSRVIPSDEHRLDPTDCKMVKIGGSLEGPNDEGNYRYFHPSGLLHDKDGKAYVEADKVFVRRLYPVTAFRNTGIQYIELDLIVRLFITWAHSIQGTIRREAHLPIVPVNFVYKKKYVFATTYDSIENVFAMDGMTIYKKVTKGDDVEAVLKKYNHLICFLVDVQLFTPRPGVFTNEAIAVLLQPIETVIGRFANYKRTVREIWEGVWDMEILVRLPDKIQIEPNSSPSFGIGE